MWVNMPKGNSETATLQDSPENHISSYFPPDKSGGK
jgi:hypothetical protein